MKKDIIMSYTHLTLRERCFIESNLTGNEKLSLRKIALALGRNHSSISREIEVNLDKDFGFYSGLRAHNLAIERRAASVTKVSKIDKIVDKVGNFIFEELQKRVSPEQICGRLKRVHGIRISYVTLYKFIELDKLKGGELYKNLRHGIKRYRKCRTKSKLDQTTKKKQRISQRPEIANLKQEPGHWEGDLVFGLLQQSYLLTLTDKASKYQITRYLPNKEALTVLKTIQGIVATSLLPFKTMTFDNGTEFNLFELITETTGADCYFAEPYHSWERGLNEHHNGLLRDYWPKGTDFNLITDNRIQEVNNDLNNRPRKSLNYLTPAEVMANYVIFGKLVHLQL